MLSMDSGDIGLFLDAHEVGVLSLAADGEAYGVPESYGYREGRIYFELAVRPEGRKRRFLDQTDQACFTVTESNSSRDFASVVAHGTLAELPEDEEAATLALGANDQFPSSHVFPDHEPAHLRAYEFEIEEITGRKGPDYVLAEGGAGLRPATTSD